MRGAWKSVRDNIHNIATDDNALAEMARAYGVINSAANEHIMTEYVDNHYMPPKLRKMNEVFFKWTGLNWYTDFTRKAALAVGIDYIQQQAELYNTAQNSKTRAKAQAALKELGITPLDVQAWLLSGKPSFLSHRDGGVTGPAIERVAEGLVQFVDESIMRPTHPSAPSWRVTPG